MLSLSRVHTTWLVAGACVWLEAVGLPQDSEESVLMTDAHAHLSGMHPEPCAQSKPEPTFCTVNRRLQLPKRCKRGIDRTRLEQVTSLVVDVFHSGAGRGITVSPFSLELVSCPTASRAAATWFPSDGSAHMHNEFFFKVKSVAAVTLAHGHATFSRKRLQREASAQNVGQVTTHWYQQDVTRNSVYAVKPPCASF